MSVDDLVAVLGYQWFGMDPGHVLTAIHLPVSVVFGFTTDTTCFDLYREELFIFDWSFVMTLIANSISLSTTSR